MIRLFNVYYPTRTLVLLLCEALLVGGSFLLATACLVGPDTYIVLFYENGILKIAGITVLTLLLSYYFDLYEPQRISGRWEIYFRLLLVLSVLSFVLAALLYFFPELTLARMFFSSAPPSSRLFSLSGDRPMSGSSVFRYSASASMCWAAASGRAPLSKLCAPGAMPAWKSSMERARAHSTGTIERFAADLRAFLRSENPH